MPSNYSKKNKNFQIWIVGLVTLFICLGLWLCREYSKINRIFKGNDSNKSVLQTHPSKRTNLLFLGIGGATHNGGELTDTIILISIDPVNKTAALFSIPRDLWVNPKGLDQMKINAIYTKVKSDSLNKGKNERTAVRTSYRALEKEVKKVTGLPIHYHVRIDFTGFEEAINVLGGIDIAVDSSLTVTEKLWDIPTKSYYLLDVKEGQQHFDGQRALHYSRSRYTSVYGDFSRNARQRKLLIALKEKLFSVKTLFNPFILSNLLSALENHVDTNLSINDIFALYNILATISVQDISSISLTSAPVKYLRSTTLNKISVVGPRVGFFCYKEVHNLINNTLQIKEKSSIVY